MSRVSLFLLVAFFTKFTYGIPVRQLDAYDADSAPLEIDPESEVTVIRNFTDKDLDDTSKDLFVIKTIVYEIGILTDAGNDTDFDNDTHEVFDVAFFDPDNNGSFVDLSHIPIPIQTNVSGVSITGIIPANFGDLALLNDGTPTVNGSHFPLFPNKQVKVSHNISTYDKDKTNSLLEGLPEILGLKDVFKHKNVDNLDSSEKDDHTKADENTKEDQSDESDDITTEKNKKESVDTEEIDV